MEASSRVFSLSFSWRIRSFISFWERAREWVRSVSIGFVVLRSLARWIQGPSVGRSSSMVFSKSFIRMMKVDRFVVTVCSFFVRVSRTSGPRSGKSAVTVSRQDRNVCGSIAAEYNGTVDNSARTCVNL